MICLSEILEAVKRPFLSSHLVLSGVELGCAVPGASSSWLFCNPGRRDAMALVMSQLTPPEVAPKSGSVVRFLVLVGSEAGVLDVEASV